MVTGLVKKAGATLVLAGVLSAAAFGAARADGAPYPQSEVLTGITFDWTTLRRLGREADNWAMTWARDGSLLASFGDGPGIEGRGGFAGNTSIGIARLYGNSATTIRGNNLIGGLGPSLAPCLPALDPLPEERGNNGCRGGLDGKSYGILALGEYVYNWVAPGSNAQNYRPAHLMRARLGTNVWAIAPWGLGRGTEPPMVLPTFLQAGRNMEQSDQVIAYAARLAPAERGELSIQRGEGGGAIYGLTADAGADLLDRGSWSSLGGEGPVFRDPNGVGWTTSATYLPQDGGRYILITEHERSFASNIGVFESSSPSGPWRTVYYGKLGAGEVPQKAFFYNIVPSSIRSDGRFTLAFTGVDQLDALMLVDASFERGD